MSMTKQLAEELRGVMAPAEPETFEKNSGDRSGSTGVSDRSLKTAPLRASAASVARPAPERVPAILARRAGLLAG